MKNRKYRKQWEIVFRLEQIIDDVGCMDRVKNYEKILQLEKELRAILVLRGIPLGFSIISRESGIREQKEEGTECFGGVAPEELTEFR